MGDPGQSINDMMIAVRRDVVAETHDAQRPWEQGSLLDRFEFVPVSDAVAAAATEAKPAEIEQAEAKPAAPKDSGTQVAALERSVGDAKAIENFLRADYLSPDTNAMRDAVKRVYGDSAKLFGTELDLDAITKIKTDWFAQFSSWSLVLEPGSLEITQRGELRADVSFAMSYDYQPKANAATHITGRTHVQLELVMTEAGWRVASETGEALK